MSRAVVTDLVADPGVEPGDGLAPALAGARRVSLRSLCHGLLAWLVVLNGLDLLTTKAVLDRGGTESNPVMEPIVDSLLHAAAVKGLCLLVVVLLVLRCRPQRRVALVLGVVNLWYLAVVVWNAVVLLHA